MQTILFFDIDSTLVENHFSYSIVAEVMKPVFDATARTSEEIGAELFEENTRRQQEDPNNVLTMDWDDIVATVAANHSVTLSASLIDLWCEKATSETVELLDQADEVIKTLKQPHRKLVISTKGLSKYQTPVLQAVGLHGMFDDYLTPDITGYLKTEPEYFNKYRRNGTNTRFIQIGDHYYDDVICGQRNGFTTIMRVPIDELKQYDPFERPAHLIDYREQIPTYPKEGTDVLPDIVVVSLQELPPIIEALEKQ